MYESDTTAVNRYNATLTADGDFANGQGLGWVPTNNAQEYRLSEIFTNEEGILRVQGLPYGQYIVVETTVPKDVFQAEPFLINVNASSPQSSFTVPAGSITTPSGSYITYNILDEELEGYLQLVKIDIETGKPVKIADTAFNIYYIAEDGRETLVEMNDPKSGNAWAKTSTFYTDSNGEMKTPEKLPLGIINHCILRPGRRCCNVCRMVKRQLVVFRPVVHAVICKEIAVIQQLLRSVIKFKIVTDPLIGAFQDDLEVIKPFVLRFHLHLYRRENNRCQAAGSICIKQRAVL